MISRRSALGALPFFVFLDRVSGEDRTKAIHDACAEFMRTSQYAKDFSGTVLVSLDGKPIFDWVGGLANRELGVANNLATKFRIGSMTKPFTATAVFLLREKGDLALEDALDRYLSDLPASWKPLTLYQLLTHTSGLMHSWDLPDFASHSMVPATMDETIGRFKGQPLVAPPAAVYHYSGLGYFILASVIEKVSELRYEDFLAKRIFQAIGMTNTGGDHPESVLPNRASGYRIKDGRMEHAPCVYMPIMTGAGNLYSTVEDLNRFEAALHSRQLVSQRSLDVMMAPAIKGEPYGAGLELLMNPKGEKVVGHNGSVNGFIGAFYRVLGRSVTGIALSNIAYAASPTIAAELTDMGT